MSQTRILICFDTERWAWHYRAMDLQAFAPDDYAVDICRDTEVVYQDVRQYDAAFFFSWRTCNPQRLRGCGVKRVVGLVTSPGLRYEGYDPNNWRSKSWTPRRGAEQARRKLPHFDAILAVNRELYDAVDTLLCGVPHEVHLIPSGVNTTVFTPRTRKRVGPFAIGWCGSPRGERSVKGWDEILLPLMAELRNDGFKWEINATDYRTPASRKVMAEWYAGLDVLISTSVAEGTPSPPFEAAACGVPLFCTDVGCVTDWAFPHVAGLVAPAYHNAETAGITIRWFADKLRRALKRRGTSRELGAQMRGDIVERYGYEVIAPKYLGAIAGTKES